jgi:hypothetical protein
MLHKNLYKQKIPPKLIERIFCFLVELTRASSNQILEDLRKVQF